MPKGVARKKVKKKIEEEMKVCAVLLWFMCIGLCTSMLLPPEMPWSLDAPPARQEGMSDCDYGHLRAFWKLFDIMKHLGSDYLLVFADIKEMLSIWLSTFWACIVR